VRSFKLKKPDNQYNKLSEDIKVYSRLRLRPKKRTKKIITQLLRLQERMITQLQTMLNQYRKDVSLLQGGWSDKDQDKLTLCRTILKQQKALRRNPDSRIPDRICSWAKPYLRPIVRGKENKQVEFGCFVNTIYVDGIQLIEHADFKMYHEGNRLPYSVIKYSNELGTCTQFGGDQKYATNKNRDFCKKRGIFTSFRAKGAPPKEEHKVQQRQLQKELGVIRATHLEGSYGNEKNHYGLKKIRARGEANELAWIFFGIFTSNAVSIAKRRQKKKVKPKPAQTLALKAKKVA
jgi:transposase, IS5 family